MVRSKRILIPVTIVAILGVFLIAFLYFSMNRDGERHQAASLFYENSLQAADISVDAFASMDQDYNIGQNFTSNLPIFIFVRGNEKENGWESGLLEIYDWGDDNNLFVSPTTSVSVRLKEESVRSGIKPDIDIEMDGKAGEMTGVSLLGLAPDQTWHLSSMRNDTSMVRDYTAYRTASMIMEEVPRVAYCEVLYEEGGEITYQGLYELTETVGVGQGKVEVKEPQDNMVRVPYFVVSDTSRQGKIIGSRQLETRYQRAYTSLLYPPEERLSQEQMRYIENRYQTITDRVHNLDDYTVVLDVDALIDYYIVNMYFGNYMAGKTNTYLTDSPEGKLKLGPVYGFELALGNDQGTASDPEKVSFDGMLFLEDLVADSSFVSQFLDRFVELRRTVLRDQVIFAFIDEARDYLSVAKQRDDRRWRGDETTTEIPAIYRSGSIESNNYELDLYRIKSYLTTHATEVRTHFAKIEEEQRIASRFTSGNTLLLFVSLVLFFIPSILINRKG